MRNPQVCPKALDADLPMEVSYRVAPHAAAFRALSSLSLDLSAVLYSTCSLISSNIAIDHSQALTDSQLAQHCMCCVHTILTSRPSSIKLYHIVSASQTASCHGQSMFSVSLHKRQQACFNKHLITALQAPAIHKSPNSA